MSFGALSGNPLTALNRRAAKGGFAHDTGEGGLSKYHLNGADVVWEIGTGYFGARTKDGGFDREQFREKAAHEAIKCVSLKLSQGAKPGIGGVLPGAKVTKEIADARSVPQGQTCVSPPGHKVFSTPRELIQSIAEMRELAGGKPADFKLCVGTRHELLAVCNAMRAEGTAPDFIIVDGSEGGTGAAPGEYEDHMGTPLTEGLMMLHNSLVGCGLRDKIRIGCSGKVATGSDIVKRLAQGADYCNAARAMMMAVGACRLSAVTPTNAQSGWPRRIRNAPGPSTCPTRPSASVTISTPPAPGWIPARRSRLVTGCPRPRGRRPPTDQRSPCPGPDPARQRFGRPAPGGRR
jgi:glutamate synthase domain-containing protein 2